MTSYRVRQIYYKPSQIGRLETDWVPYYNNGGVTPYFENDIITELYLASDHQFADYYGVFSWKFLNKHQKNSTQIEKAMSDDRYSHDVYSFFRNQQFKGRAKKNTFYDNAHPNLLELGELIVDKLFGEDISKIQADRIYYNHWLAKSNVFGDYCKEMLLPAMELMEGELKELVWSDAKYNRGVNRQHLEANRPMNAEQCMAAFGVPYYTHHAFVLERLPSIYFALKGLKIKQI